MAALDLTDRCQPDLDLVAVEHSDLVVNALDLTDRCQPDLYLVALEHLDLDRPDLVLTALDLADLEVTDLPSRHLVRGVYRHRRISVLNDIPVHCLQRSLHDRHRCSQLH